MIEGTAASRSTTKETGPEARLCRYWVRNRATPTATGTARTIATIELSTVVHSSPAMPKLSWSPATTQLREVRKLSWLRSRLGRARAEQEHADEDAPAAR